MVGGAPGGPYQKHRKPLSKKQPKQPKTLANLMEIKGNGRGCPKGPYHKPPKPLNTNTQNQQNHKKRADLT
jgi:hypothetical protein